MLTINKKKVVKKLTIGQRIKNRRIELGLSVDELASKLGKNRATIYRYEKDDIKDLPITVLEPLAKVLETTPADLMGWEQIDPYCSGKEASPEIYEKLKNNIEKHHGNQKELNSIYEQLSSDNRAKILESSKQLLQNQSSGKTSTSEQHTTLAAHFAGEEYTEDELNEIRQFAEFVKNKRK